MRSQNSKISGFLSQNAKLLLVAFAGLVFIVYATSGRNAAENGGIPPRNGATKCPIFGKRYGIMMDAGSTGSRTHVFEFDFHPDGTIGLNKEIFEQVKPGLSSYKGDPKAASDSIVPLMEVARRDVPVSAVPCTPVALKATAGLRLIGAKAATAILERVDAMIRTYGFDAPRDVAVVMDGRDEGPYAWITVNFLLEHLGAASKPTTAAIMDMGGASTQIVFQPDRPDVALANAPAEFIYEATLLGTKHRMYQNSYLGLGLKEAVKTAAKAQLKAGNGAAFACLPKGYEFAVSETEKLTNGGAQSFEACAAAIGKALIDKSAPCGTAPCAFNGIYQPKLRDVFSGPIYAFSYFYDRIEAWLPEDGQITVGTYKTVGTKLCASEGSEGEMNKGTMCADLAYLYTLLTEGYGLVDSEKLYIKKKIKGIETAWALGAMIEMMK